jgi:deoxyribonuclease-4
MKKEAQTMPYLGCHLSPSAGYYAMGQTALQLGADTFQFFTRNPRGGKAKDPDPKDLAALCQMQQQGQLGPVVAHAAYTINPCGADERVRAFALEAMADDLQRMEHLPGNLYNFHPGSHVGQGIEVGVEKIAQTLNEVLPIAEHTTVLLETMAGKGSEVGGAFAELRSILDAAAYPERMGVCLDTCHVFDGGYDIVQNLDGVLEEFDRIIGLDKLKALHLNDSLHGFSSHKDRHAKIGEGHIGLSAFCAIIRHPALQHLPMVLETPNDLAGYAAEIAILRQNLTKTGGVS